MISIYNYEHSKFKNTEMDDIGVHREPFYLLALGLAAQTGNL